MTDAAKPETVSVRSLQWHTYAGVAHDVGDVYDLPADLLDTIVVQGKAERADRPAAAPPPPPAPPRR